MKIFFFFFLFFFFFFFFLGGGGGGGLGTINWSPDTLCRTRSECESFLSRFQMYFFVLLTRLDFHIHLVC